MLIKDRCIGVFDLESPELDAFSKEHQELLTLLASQAAVAIDNARLYEEVSRNEERIEKELRFARRVQLALLPTEPPKSCPRCDVAGRFESAYELGGDIHDFLAPETEALVVAVGDVSGKGAPAALYGAYASELVRSRTLRRRFTPDRFSVSGVLQAMNTTLHERQLEAYYCTLCYAFFDFRRRQRDALEFRPPLPDPLLVDIVRTNRVARRSSRILSRRHLRRSQPRVEEGRCVRVLHGRHLRSVERRGCRVRRDPSDGFVSREREGSARARIVDAIFETVTAVSRDETAGRRHDGGCRQDHRLTRRAEKLGRARIVKCESGAGGTAMPAPA